MSKFIDNLKKVCESGPPPIGFLSRKQSVRECRMQVLAMVAPENLDRASEFIKGADAVLLPIAGENPTKKRLTGFAGAAGGVPWGGWLKGKSTGVTDLVKAGCDFVVFSSRIELSMTVDDKMGKILEVEPSIPDALLRAANSLPVDAVLIDDDSLKECPLTWQHLIQYQRCAALLTKPVLAVVPVDAGSEELKLLWEAGIDGAVVDTEGLAPEQLETFRKTLDDTKFPPRGRRHEKPGAILPRSDHRQAAVEQEEEEEE